MKDFKDYNELSGFQKSIYKKARRLGLSHTKSIQKALDAINKFFNKDDEEG